MPFIVQCPHADCRRFMLLEDEARGTMVNCLICSRQIRVDAAGSGERKQAAGNKPAAPPPQPSVPAAALQSDQKVIVNCPNLSCRSPLKVAPSAKGTQLRCPKCKQVFTA